MERRTDPVEVALLRAHLDREPTRVTGRVGAAALTTDGRETDGQRACRARGGGEELGACEVGDGVGEGEGPVCACALGVDDSLGDPLMVEVCKKIDVVEILFFRWEI